MGKGKINLSVENIFPLIKKFLYSDQEIFIRELVSNATDALTKINHMSSVGKIKGDIEDLGIEIKVNKKDKTFHIIDNGVGMTAEEVKKYINDIAFLELKSFLKNIRMKKMMQELLATLV
jgi:molecular chaperone HtpG